YVGLDLTARASDSMGRIGQALSEVNSSRGEVVVPDLSQAPREVRAEVVRRSGGALPEPVTMDLELFRAGHAQDFHLLEQHGRFEGENVVLTDVAGAPDFVRRVVVDNMGGHAVVRLSDFADPAQANAEAWLHGERLRSGDADGVVLRLKTDNVPA